MKKMLTRTLSMLLVLMMLISVLPMALATDGPVDGGGGDGTVGGETFDDPTTPPTNPDPENPENPENPDPETPVVTPVSVSVSAGKTELTLENGSATTQLTAVLSADKPGYTVDYEWSGTGVIAQSTPTKATFVATKAGDYPVSVFVTFTSQTDSTDVVTIKGTATIKVLPEAQELETVIIKGADKVGVGGTTALTFETVPADYVPEVISWVSLDMDEVAISKDGVVTGLKEAKGARIWLNVDGVTDTYTIDVVDGLTTVTVDKEVVVAVGESDYIDVAISPEEAGTGATITYKSNKTSVATVTSTGRVTGVKVGETTVDVSVKNVENFENDTFSVKIIVTDEDLTCDVETASASSSSKSVTLDPKYNGEEKDVTFTYTKIDSRGTISVNADGVVTANGPAAIRVKVQAKDKDGKVLAECYSGAAFYESNDVEVTMPEGNTTLGFSSRTDIKESGNLLTLMLANYTRSDSDRVYVSDLSTEEGTLSGTGWISTEGRTTAANLGNLTFTVGTKGDAKFSYQIVMGGYEDMPLLKGTVEIDYDAQISGIQYSGTYNQNLTFSEADFKKYWDACDMDGTLEYIKLLSLPSATTEGTLYTHKTSRTATYKASTSHEFWYGSYTSGTNRKDLGSLTFVPVTTKKTEYTVYIPFLAYGEEDNKTVTLRGYIIINMNEPSNDITARGTFFGTEYDTTNDLTYADQIADAYKAATGKNLGIVIFQLPEPEQAHLYYKIPSNGTNVLVAQGKHLPYNTELYYDDNTSSTLDLEDAAIVPAAGFSGQITLKYEASDEDGKNEWDGTISFNVTKKTKSAVFNDVGTNYSWAADSVDFLYYEGTAQGSNNKYNPASNITRGDFMLMLYRAFLEEDYGTYNVTSNFPDVVKGTSSYSQETYQAVGVAKYLGIAQGTNNKFNPKAPITREEAMALIQRTLDKTNRDLDYTTTVRASSFNDYSSISTWARDTIDELVKHGVIVGSNNKVNPKSNITRAEMACILHRVITY